MNRYPRLAAVFAACPLPVCVVDTESTGGSFADDRLTEIAVYRFENGAMDTFRSLINPCQPIPPFIRKLTGIDDETVADAPVFEDIAPQVKSYLQGCLLVAHNSRFDYTFLQHEFGRCRTAFAVPTLCTVRLSRRLYPQHFKHSLDSIAARHGISGAGRHRAEADVAVLCAFLEQAVAEYGREYFLQVFADLADPGFPSPDLPVHLQRALFALSGGSGLLVLHRRHALPELLPCSQAFREAFAYLNRNGGEGIETVEFLPAAGILHTLTLLAAEMRRYGLSPQGCGSVYHTVRWHETDGRLQARISLLEHGFYPQPPTGLFLHPKAARQALAEWVQRGDYCPSAAGLSFLGGADSCPLAEARLCAGGADCGRGRPDLSGLLSAAAGLPVAGWGKHTSLTISEADPCNGLAHVVRCCGGAVEWREGSWFFDSRIPKAVKQYLKQGSRKLCREN